MVSRFPAPKYHQSTIETPSCFHRQISIHPKSTIKTKHQMSENKLRKFINKQTPPISGKKLLQPIVLSDSKGRYIEKFYRDTTEKQLIIISQSGLKAEESKKWLKRNIAKKIIEHGDIWLYI